MFIYLELWKGFLTSSVFIFCLYPELYFSDSTSLKGADKNMFLKYSIEDQKVYLLLFPLFFQSIVKHEINFMERAKSVPFVISIIFSEHCQVRDQSY